MLARVVPRIEAELERRLEPPDAHVDPASARLASAIRYAALGPGKRLRPALAVAACEAVGGTLAAALPAAAAVELLHAYTLVHDDLPAMDDDRERRGRPTVHIAYDEATAILAGDALLTLAFSCLADLESGAAAALTVLARRAGPAGLLAGQARDLALGDREPDLETLDELHALKTGALFAAAAELGAIAAGAPAERDALSRFGMSIGIAFQHADDRDDGDFAGTAAGARERRRALGRDAEENVSALGPPAAPLVALARWFADS